jgi:hypothetical protein
LVFSGIYYVTVWLSDGDAVKVFLRSGTQLHIDNSLILSQIKNDSKFTCEPKLAPEYFAAMDPYEVDILKAGDTAVPLIKIFFRSRR